MVEAVLENVYAERICEFLNVPLDSADEIFERFASLPEAVAGVGNKPLERYVYIPGKREDRVLLVAHTDTVWDKAYTGIQVEKHSVAFEDGVFRSSNPNFGIGADDRAGCAMLWELRESGHSLLIVDGEEHGKIGAKYLKKSNKKIFREINRHNFIIEFDLSGTEATFNRVDNTKKFKKYVEKAIGFRYRKSSGGTDIQVLCRNICGVNIGIGYYKAHIKDEMLVLSEWITAFNKLSDYLEKPQKKFRISVPMRCVRIAKRCVKKILRILNIKKVISPAKGA